MENKDETIFIENSVKPEYKSDIKWIEPQELKPLSEYEKNMLKGTINASELLEKEKKEQEEKVEISEEEKEKQMKRDYINKLKVVALDKIGKYPLDNPSYFTIRDKKKLLETMETLRKLPEDELTELFNSVCCEVLFAPQTDYSKFPVYK
jgi:hypothetical protein